MVVVIIVVTIVVVAFIAVVFLFLVLVEDPWSFLIILFLPLVLEQSVSPADWN